jgi:hypothetical protein
MRRSMTCVGWTLGSAALLALGLGCSRESPPPEVPAGTPSPPFESNVPPGPAPAMPEPPGANPAPLAPGSIPETGPMGQAGQPPQPPPPPRTQFEPAAPPEAMQHRTEQPAPAASGANEHQLCDALASGAKLHVEDVQNGVTIIAVPRAGHDLANVHDDAQRIASALRQRPAAEGQATGDACGLFSVARQPDVMTTITDGRASVRIVMTTSNPAAIHDLRRAARDQVTSLSKMAPGRR